MNSHLNERRVKLNVFSKAVKVSLLPCWNSGVRSGPQVDGKSHQNNVELAELEQNEKSSPELGKVYFNYLA